MIKKETVKRFKDTVRKLMKQTDYNPSDSPFDILVLDIREKKDRIEYCGYEPMVKSQFGDSLPFIGSPIKVIVRVPQKNREVLAGVTDKPLEDGEEGVYPYEGDVFLMYSNNAFLNTPATGNKGSSPVTIFSLGLPVEKIKEVILDVMPIEYEVITEIYGFPPETIKPNRTAYLEKIIGKIQRTAILSEKGIH